MNNSHDYDDIVIHTQYTVLCIFLIFQEHWSFQHAPHSWRCSQRAAGAGHSGQVHRYWGRRESVVAVLNFLHLFRWFDLFPWRKQKEIILTAWIWYVSAIALISVCLIFLSVKKKTTKKKLHRNTQEMRALFRCRLQQEGCNQRDGKTGG